MAEIERELRFLVEKLPTDIDKFPSKIIEDNYIPSESDHPVIRIRRNGDKLVITKKHPVGTTGDSSRQIEHSIDLTPAEYAALNQYRGKKFIKRRFSYNTHGYEAEIDVYLDKLAGLVVIDFEFDSDEAMAKFQKPAFLGADVTQDDIIAGGTLAGKSYSDIAAELKAKYNYQPVKGVEKYHESTNR